MAVVNDMEYVKTTTGWTTIHHEKNVLGKLELLTTKQHKEVTSRLEYERDTAQEICNLKERHLQEAYELQRILARKYSPISSTSSVVNQVSILDVKADLEPSLDPSSGLISSSSSSPDTTLEKPIATIEFDLNRLDSKIASYNLIADIKKLAFHLYQNGYQKPTFKQLDHDAAKEKLQVMWIALQQGKIASLTEYKKMVMAAVYGWLAIKHYEETFHQKSAKMIEKDILFFNLKWTAYKKKRRTCDKYYNLLTKAGMGIMDIKVPKAIIIDKSIDSFISFLAEVATGKMPVFKDKKFD